MKGQTKHSNERNTIFYEASHRNNFFQRKFETMEWRRRNFPKHQGEFDLTCNVTMLSKQGLIKKKTILLLNNIIVTTKKDGEKCWLNYENSSLEVIENQNLGKGLKLTKCFNKIEFYGEEIGTLHSYLKKFTIQFDFSKYYTLKKKLHHIENAEVFKIQSKIDYGNYQCIIFQKSFVNMKIERQIEKEAFILRRINEENIQKFYEIFENVNQIMIVTELLHGGSLFEYIEKWSYITEDAAVKLFFKIFKSLAYLHSIGIMHRNLKPQNILLRLNGNLDSICIVSFGLADIYDINTLSDNSDSEEDKKQFLFQICGTPGYIAPEILHNKCYDCKVDVFSVGIILYYTLTGKLPFYSEDNQKILEDNKIGKIDFSKVTISDIGMNFLENILNTDQNSRWTSQMALNSEWLQSEKHSRLQEFKQSHKIKEFKHRNYPSQSKYQKTGSIFPQINQNSPSQDNSPKSPMMTFSPQLNKSTSVFHLHGQTNSPKVTSTTYHRRNTGNLSPLQLPQQNPSIEKAAKIQNTLKKSIFNIQ